MFFKLKIFLSAGVLFFSLNSVLFAQNKVGTTAAPFLGISVGPRAQAMGSAVVAQATDVSSIYWNPGALARIQESEFMVSRTQWLMGTNFNWVGLNINLGTGTAVGLSLTQLDYGREEITHCRNRKAPDAIGTLRIWRLLSLCPGL